MSWVLDFVCLRNKKNEGESCGCCFACAGINVNSVLFFTFFGRHE